VSPGCSVGRFLRGSFTNGSGAKPSVSANRCLRGTGGTSRTRDASRRLAESNRQLDMAASRRRGACQRGPCEQSQEQFSGEHVARIADPPHAIIGYSEMLQEEALDLDQKGLVPDLEKIHGAGKHLLGLINDVLDLSKIEAGKMTLYLEDFDVAKIVLEVASTVQPLIAKNGTNWRWIARRTSARCTPT